MGRCRRLLAAASTLLALVATPVAVGETSPSPARDARPNATFPAEIPLKRGPAPDEAAANDAIVWIGVLVLGVLAGFPLLRWGYRRTPPGRRPPALERWLGQRREGSVRLLESVRLTERHSLHLVAWQRKKLLLACSDQTVTVIERGEADDAATGAGTEDKERRVDAA